MKEHYWLTIKFTHGLYAFADEWHSDAMKTQKDVETFVILFNQVGGGLATYRKCSGCPDCGASYIDDSVAD